jgi:hypothetical protein
MAEEISLATALLALTAPQAFAGTATPGPELGDGVPGFVVVLALIASFFAFRHFRKRSA